MFNYCFIRVSDNMLVFVMVFISRFGRCSVRNVVAGYTYRWILYLGFVSLIMYHLSQCNINILFRRSNSAISNYFLQHNESNNISDAKMAYRIACMIN